MLLRYFRYDKDFYATRIKSDPAANVVEILRIKHWLIRQLADTLNNLFGVHMGLSVFYLWAVMLFDMYYKMFDKNPSETLVYAWLLQYSLRLLMIILMAHYTTKQVCINLVSASIKAMECWRPQYFFSGDGRQVSV